MMPKNAWGRAIMRGEHTEDCCDGWFESYLLFRECGSLAPAYYFHRWLLDVD